MDKFVFLISIIIFGCILYSSNSSSDQITSYTNVTTLNSADLIPTVSIAHNTNQNINWDSLKELVSKNINWTDVKSLTKSHGTGSTSGINWQDFGA